MQQLKISFSRLQTLKNALLFKKIFQEGGGKPPFTPPPDHYKIIFCPPLAKVLVAPLIKSKFNLGSKTGLFQAVRLDPHAVRKKNFLRFVKYRFKKSQTISTL